MDPVVEPADSGAGRVQVRQSGASWWIESECGCGAVGWSPEIAFFAVFFGDFVTSFVSLRLGLVTRDIRELNEML
jgi:hypothetical protein